MRFITENELREQFKTMPMEVFEAAADVRLTPGARQFLIDRGIDLYHSGEESQMARPSTIRQDNGSVTENLQRQASLNAFILESILDLSQWDQPMAEQLRNIYQWMNEGAQGKAESVCRTCNGMNPSTFPKALPDCFPIEEDMCPLAQYRAILRLHRIRCQIRELGQTPVLNETVNGISQLICATLGGGKCKTK